MRILGSAQHLLDWLTEFVGTKSGLLFRESEVIRCLDQLLGPEEYDAQYPTYASWWRRPHNDGVSLRAEELEGAAIAALHSSGAISDTLCPTDVVLLFAKEHAESLGIDLASKGMPGLQRLMLFHSYVVARILYDDATEGDEPPASRDAIFQEASETPAFKKMLEDYRVRYIMDMTPPESRSWDGRIPLSSLFEGGTLHEPAVEGPYFDQRYIDFLGQNSQELSRVHWRQFELMTAEWLDRQGFQIRVMPGSKDGGKDIIATRGDGLIGPERLIIQCKRYSAERRVGLEAIKAFWATLDEDGATRGLIATTTRLTKGAREYCQARQYRLGAAEGERVQEWLRDMTRRGTKVD